MKNEKLNRWLRSKWVWTVIGAIILIIIASVISYDVGYSKNKAMVDGKLISYYDLVKKVADKNKTLTDTNNKVDDAISKLTDEKDILSNLQQTYDDTQTKLADVIQMGKDKGKLKSEISDNQSKLSDLKSQISSEQSKLQSLKGGIQEAKTAPVTIGAGNFLVGKDIPAGRYKAEPIGEGSNFVVYGSDDSLQVDTILGAGGVPSYVFVASDGDVINSEAPAKLVHVK